MTSLPETRVAGIRVYPTSGEPGHHLNTVQIGSDGLDGDRRKKAAVHLVSLEDQDTRANLVLDTTPEAVLSTVGQRLVLGTAVLVVERAPSGCPGVYAAVVEPGTVSVGDGVREHGPGTEPETAEPPRPARR